MKRPFLILALTAVFTACNQQPKEKEFVCPTSLEEIEFFYFERAPQILHIDPNCAKTNCTYIENTKWKLDYYEDCLCGKCISGDLAKEIIKHANTAH
jgi:hypothetical protein